MKYELKEEFAGRQTRCRTCRLPLTVPAPAVPLAAPARIDGPRSSLHQLGISGGVTLNQSLSDPARPAAPPPTRDVLPATVSVPRPVGPSGPRYQVAGELGRGGMGVVLRALDLDIRREVAVKYLLDADDQRKRARFVEEAQITGRGRDLSPLQGMKLTDLNLRECEGVTDLSPLAGMPLTSLNLVQCRGIRDLTPLAGMRLTVLKLSDVAAVTDLSCLKGMPLQELELKGTQVRDLTALAGMPLRTVTLPSQVTTGMEVLRQIPTLERIHQKPAAEFWKEYDAKKPDK